MPSIFLIRHAEPEVRGVLLGRLDPPLSPAGREQALQALSGMRFPVAWTSPLRRARETAACLNTGQVIDVPGFREIDHGAWTGKTWEAIEASWPEHAARKVSDWLGIAAPEGEKWPLFLARVQSAWNGVRQGPPDAAVVAHQGVNAALAYLIAGWNPLDFTQNYGEVIRLDYD